MTRTILLLLGFTLWALSVGATNPQLFLGQKPPENKAQKLAPGIISTDEHQELNAVFSPDGTEFYFCRVIDGVYRLFRMRKTTSGSWDNPERIHLKAMDDYEIVDPWITPDGKKMLYISNAPAPGFKEGSVNIWEMERERDGWGIPTVLSRPINSDGNEIYPLPVASGNLYFNSTRINRGNDRDIYVAEFRDGTYNTPVNLGPPVSSTDREGDVFVAPDESYLIVTSTKADGYGRSDLYISYRQSDNSWGELKNLGPEVNSPEYDFTPVVSPDGQYLFFTRTGDLYWIATKSLEAMQQKN